jgi:hypothetical protein
MKKIIPLLVLLAACHGNADFSKVKVGMHSKDVVSLVGEPGNKTPMMGVEWWSYDKDNKLIVMESDTVSRVVQDMKATQDSMKNIMSSFGQKMDSLKQTLDTTAQK